LTTALEYGKSDSKVNGQVRELPEL